MPKDFEEKMSFNEYIKRVLKRPDSRRSINDHALITVNMMLHNLVRKVGVNAGSFIRDNGKKAIKVHHVTGSLKLALDGQLFKMASNSGVAALGRYESSAPGTKSNPVALTTRAGLIFPPSRLKHLLQQYVPGSSRVETKSAVYLAGALQAIVDDLLEIARGEAEAKKKIRISRGHLKQTVMTDAGLNKAFYMGKMPRIPLPMHLKSKKTK